MRRFLLLSALLISLPAAAETLASFKDELFAYPAILSEADGGAYRIVDYNEVRDIDGRDETPELRVRSNYVALAIRKHQRDLVAETALGKIPHIAVGRTDAASMIVLYIHGQGGSRKQGVDDYTFGGNFNRVKNLVAAAGGLYLSPDFSSFDDKGVGEIAALIDLYVARSPGAPVIVACGSMGGAICYGLAARKPSAALIEGILLLGSFADGKVLDSAAVKRGVPIFFGHGSNDKVFGVDTQEALYRALRKSRSPVRFVRFETGTHGTPIRMTDWRETLNWILSAR